MKSRFGLREYDHNASVQRFVFELEVTTGLECPYSQNDILMKTL